MTRLFPVVILAFAGCTQSVEGPTRTFTFDFDLDDPAGFYCVELREGERAAIRQDLTLPVRESHVSLDRAFLRNACINLKHRGKMIPNGAYRETSRSEGINYWVVRRDESAILYYIGSKQQYVSLDRTRPHSVGNRVIQL